MSAPPGSFQATADDPKGERLYPQLDAGPVVVTPTAQVVVAADGDEYDDRPCACSTYSCSRENKARGNWKLGIEYTLAAISVLVGCGTIWRFPYLMYAHGGAAVLVPFTLFMIILGGPVLYLESTIGQYSSNGVLTCWEFFPLLKGIGVAMIVISGIVSLYYSTIVGYVAYYLYESFKAAARGAPLAWTDPTQLGPECRAEYEQGVGRLVTSCSELGSNVHEGGDGICWLLTDYSDYSASFISKAIGFYDEFKASASSYLLPGAKTLEMIFFECEMSGQSEEGWLSLGPIRTQVVIPTLIVWILAFLILCWGVKSLGKVTLITVPVSLALLVVLAIRSATLPGALEGMMYFFYPRVDQLKTTMAWKSAGQQVIYSLTVGFGVHLTYSSYNRFHTDTLRHLCISWFALYVACLVATVFVAGITGFLAQRLGVSVNDVAWSGIWLAFTVMPKALGDLPVSTVWAILFFLMMFLFGIAVLCGLVETTVTGVVDQFPAVRRFRPVVPLVVCLLGFLLQLPGCTNRSLGWITWLDIWAGTWNLSIVILLECLAYFIYCCVSLLRNRHDLAAMTGWSCCCIPTIVPWAWQTGLLLLVVPACVLFLIVMAFINMPANGVYPGYDYSQTILGWLVAATPLVLLVVTAVVQIVIYAVKRDRRLVDVFLPKFWRPALGKHEARRATLSRPYV